MTEPDPPRRDRDPDERTRDPEERTWLEKQSEEVVVPPTDPVREAKQRDIDDPAHVDIDPEEWRQGGPTRTPGAVTTTGGTAGPAMRPDPGRPNPGRTAPTTPGDATSGGMAAPESPTTSDASGSPTPSGQPEPEQT